MKINLPDFYYEEKCWNNTLNMKVPHNSDIDFNVIQIKSWTFTWVEISSEGFWRCLIITKKSASKILDKYDKILILKKWTISDLSNGYNEFIWFRYLMRIDSEMPKSISSTWEWNFILKEENVNSPWLRKPQIWGIYSILSHYTVSNSVSTVVMPTWTWKTETMLWTLLTLKPVKGIIVIVPSDSLRTQISEKFINLWLFKDIWIINTAIKYPIVWVLKSYIKGESKLLDFLSKTNVLITTMSALSRYDNDTQKLISKYFDFTFLDEAHHSQASTWNNFKTNFGNKNIVQFTATPFRNDNQTLDGKIIYNYPLQKAQNDWLFKQINFLPLYWYDSDSVDEMISIEAVKVLKNDLENWCDHVLMARCKTIAEAERIYSKYYSKYTEYDPVIIHTDLKKLSISQKNNNLEKLKTLQSRIVVCVDMLWEWYDLPNLKIAALHSSHKSLWTSLQFIWRFTRKSRNIWNATFIANIVDDKFKSWLNKLYSTDSNWNKIISDVSCWKINKEIKLKELSSNFDWFNIQDISVPIESLKIKHSSIFFTVYDFEWNKDAIIALIDEIFGKDKVIYNINDMDKIFLIIEKIDSASDFSDLKELYSRRWDMHIFWYDKENSLFYVQSNNLNLAKNIIKNLTNDKYKFINQEQIFKSLYWINRLELFIVWLYEWILWWKTKYRMHAWLDIAKELEDSWYTLQKTKSNIFASWYEWWKALSVWAASKGWKVRSKFKSNLLWWKNWSRSVWLKLIDDSIEVSEILKWVLIPKEISSLPEISPLTIEWPLEIFRDYFKYWIEYRWITVGIENVSIELTSYDIWSAIFKVYSNELFMLQVKLTLTEDWSYSFEKILWDELHIYKWSSEPQELISFFNDFSPIIRYVDGSVLEWNYYTKIDYSSINFNSKRLIEYDWRWVDIKKESKWLSEWSINTKSIQYKLINDLKIEWYEIVFNDDWSWEIADVIAIESLDDDQVLNIKLFHCKYSKWSKAGSRISDLYEVCWQAQKSIRWADPKMLISQIKKRWKKTPCRFESWDERDLEIILNKLDFFSCNIEVYIVQPWLSIKSISKSQKELLTVTSQYLLTTFNIETYIYASK